MEIWSDQMFLHPDGTFMSIPGWLEHPATLATSVKLPPITSVQLPPDLRFWIQSKVGTAGGGKCRCLQDLASVKLIKSSALTCLGLLNTAEP